MGPNGPCFPVVFARLMSEAVPPHPPPICLYGVCRNNCTFYKKQRTSKKIRLIVREMAGESCGSSVCSLNNDHRTDFVEADFTS